MTDNEIYAKAEQLCKQFGITEYPVKIVELCSRYGIKVFEQYLPADVNGFIVIQDDNFKNYKTGRVISVNLTNPTSYRRYYIAKELGHFILHKNKIAATYAHRDIGQNNKDEWEAERFARSILIPEHLVRADLEGTKALMFPDSVIIRHIAKTFAVSCAVAKARLKELNMI